MKEFENNYNDCKNWPLIKIYLYELKNTFNENIDEANLKEQDSEHVLNELKEKYDYYSKELQEFKNIDKIGTALVYYNENKAKPEKLEDIFNNNNHNHNQAYRYLLIEIRNNYRKGSKMNENDYNDVDIEDFIQSSWFEIEKYKGIKEQIKQDEEYKQLLKESNIDPKELNDLFLKYQTKDEVKTYLKVYPLIKQYNEINKRKIIPDIDVYISKEKQHDKTEREILNYLKRINTQKWDKKFRDEVKDYNKDYNDEKNGQITFDSLETQFNNAYEARVYIVLEPLRKNI